jgi:hypothetical protein
VQVGKREGFGYQHYVTESLVKGEVVAEGSARPVRGLTTQWEFFDDWYPEGAVPAVLVIRAARKENARTGGKEHG